MRSILRNILIGSGAMAVMLGASAPVFGQDWRYESHNDRYRESEGVSFAEARETFIRTVADLDRVTSDNNLPGWERARLAQARTDMFDFRDHFVRGGQFDRHELDEAIGAIDVTVREAPLNPRDRELLARDLHELRELRGGVVFNQGNQGEHGSDNRPFENQFRRQYGNQPYGNYRNPQYPYNQGYGYNGYSR